MATQNNYFQIEGIEYDGGPCQTTGDSDPSTSLLDLPTGSLYQRTTGEVWWKYGNSPNQWRKLGDMTKSENLSGLTDYGVARSNLGLVIGTDVQAYDVNTAKLNVAQTWTASQHIPGSGGIASNEALGTGALASNTTGNYNTAHGVNALYSNTTGSGNTACGTYTLAVNTTGNSNTALGVNALRLNTTGNSNTASGGSALYSNTTGYNNTASGYNALYSNTTGNNNTASGANALRVNTTGYNNTANGYIALYSNTIGYNNTAIGSNALRLNTTGNNNTASGVNALYSNTTGNTNTACGANALRSNTTGNDNTASGSGSLLSNTTGIGNTANGANTLSANTTGSSNTASGLYALTSNTTGNYNTANGAGALRSNTTGNNNTASGFGALRSNTTGYSNTASGVNALNSNTTGNNNTAIGFNALYSNTTYSNCTGLGYDAQVTGDNQVQLGNSATTVYAYGAVQNRSDMRDKADIRPTVLGLDFILKLRPVDFKWDVRDSYRPKPPEPPAIEKPDENASEEDVIAYNNAMADYAAKKAEWTESAKLENLVRDGSKKRNRYHHGLIAQEVEALIKETGIDFGGYQDHSLSGGDDVKTIGYIELIAPLIKAVQELSAKVTALETKLKRSKS